MLIIGGSVHGTLVTVDAVAAEQILVTDNLPKANAYNILKPVLGSTSLVIIQGEYWKKIRKMFNPAFAPNYLQSLVPVIVEESLVFVESLKEKAKTGEVVYFLKFAVV